MAGTIVAVGATIVITGPGATSTIQATSTTTAEEGMIMIAAQATATAGKVELAAMQNVATLIITTIVTKLAAIGFNMMVVVSSIILIKH